MALKMALGYRHNIGKPRSRVVVMQHSYLRRHHRHDVGRRARRVQRTLWAAAVRCHRDSVPG
ncbi:MAG: hypothetical protein MZV49_08055 [Rhodopseudomonas palustris]|nr:hypothetical protein [Rhodopseudomonas palustris]